MKLPAGSQMFRVPLYAGRVLLCVSRDACQEALEIFKHEPDPSLKELAGVTYELWQGTRRPRKVFMIGWFDKKLDTLVHEVAHVAFRVLRHADVRISHANDEAYAYLIDAIFKRSVEAAERIKKQGTCAHPTS